MRNGIIIKIKDKIIIFNPIYDLKIGYQLYYNE